MSNFLIQTIEILPEGCRLMKSFGRVVSTPASTVDYDKSGDAILTDDVIKKAKALSNEANAIIGARTCHTKSTATSNTDIFIEGTAVQLSGPGFEGIE